MAISTLSTVNFSPSSSHPTAKPPHPRFPSPKMDHKIYVCCAFFFFFFSCGSQPIFSPSPLKYESTCRSRNELCSVCSCTHRLHHRCSTLTGISSPILCFQQCWDLTLNGKILSGLTWPLSVSFSPFCLLSASAAAVPSSSFPGPFLPHHMVFILAAKDINFIIHEKSHSN